MARGITENDVHDAADALVEAGERPTVERVRAHLGTGSPNTVTRHLESWWGRLGLRLTAQRKMATLPAAPLAISDMAAQLWDAALHTARAEASEALATDRSALAAERAAFEDQARTLLAQQQDARALAHDALQARERIEQRLSDLTGLLAELQDRAADLESQRDGAQEHVRQMQAELAQHRRQADEREVSVTAERQRHSEHMRATEDRAHAEVDRARQDVRTLQKQLDAQLRERDLATARSIQREQVLKDALAKAEREAAVARAQWEAHRLASAKPTPRKAAVKGRAPGKSPVVRRKRSP
ncbi:DNA-binding protein [Luteibacter sp. 3190]|uniref:DNA-binding protein n=1 Tax=Luteibacter sp. 3190 TaxID=2817736 RepID=UPI002866C249|nr:DNA-binding protein [Luteibacter sp. 3190]MDR6935703.1 chromosome segregation ATPase [Luteibacter sp. 3190]